MQVSECTNESSAHCTLSYTYIEADCAHHLQYCNIFVDMLLYKYLLLRTIHYNGVNCHILTHTKYHPAVNGVFYCQYPVTIPCPTVCSSGQLDSDCEVDEPQEERSNFKKVSWP